MYHILQTHVHLARSDRLKHDIDDIIVLSDIHSTFTSASIKNFYRLGKYKQTAIRQSSSSYIG